MRREVDITTAKVMDLGDQPQDDFLLNYGTPGGGSNILWVHTYAIQEKVIHGLDKDDNVVVSFGAYLPWTAIARRRVEVFTVSDLQEMERTNIADRAKVKRDLQQVYNTAEKGIPDTQERFPWGEDPRG